jgi:hypothetical protein
VKTKALYHLMVASARAAGRLLGPADQARLESAARSLSITKAKRGEVLVAWQDDATPVETIVDSARFDFYRRGDVAALVAKRPDNLDLRATNWAEAHRLWGELLHLPALARLNEPPNRSVLPAVNRSSHELVQLAAPAAVFVGVVLALTLDSVTGVAVGIGLEAAVLSRHRSLWSGASGVAVAVGLGLVLDLSVGDLASATAGIGLIAATTLIAPTPGSRWEISVITAAFAGVTMALAGPGATSWFWVASGALVGADVVALGLRHEPRRLVLTVAGVSVAAVGWLATRGVVDWPSDTSIDSDLTTALSIGLAAFLTLMVVRGFVVGVRDRLSGWLAPLALIAAALTDLTNAASVVWLSAAASVLLVDMARARLRPVPPTTTSPSEPQPMAVSIGRHNARVWPRDTNSNSPTSS